MSGFRPSSLVNQESARWFFSPEEMERKRHEMFDKHVVKRVNTGIESIFELNKEYAATGHFFKMSKSDIPAIRGKADEMHVMTTRKYR
jgi:hypothetical protein